MIKRNAVIEYFAVVICWVTFRPGLARLQFKQK